MSNLTIKLDPADVRLVKKVNEAWLAYNAAQDGTPEADEHRKRWEQAKTQLAFLFIAIVLRAEASNQ
ncbi:hypothetical protein QAO71_15795 [Halopseudomonas sp. SMJS2]|uniref:hypothetical protein n=1 Tax=Halopseudomonas sp. SMJS2 TaxID=3041098 RepID=UPI0024536DE7|nr:hypothetical protein [Halopseudomonas sp. SMJS2]WGK61488.1 hypothetical protein QAO71_15795 [Halopseudomonas sp. SMJS2]